MLFAPVLDDLHSRLTDVTSESTRTWDGVFLHMPDRTLESVCLEKTEAGSF